ncbi:MAG: alcohol dehydrogenase [Bacteroidetes bacterium HGW-Bacteroidetes-21]|jgi:outer membrane protein assembly factor BamB|nr:MAG: alcohol dehydrogenase [Bacteroidetes bacterium HGW-Bacteroidetes-21]
MGKLNYVLGTVFMLLIGYNVQAQFETQWRGLNRDGVYHETGLIKAWPADGPKILWHFDDLGKGYSSAVVVGDKIITSGMEDTTGFVYALDLSGCFLWKTAYGRDWTESWPGARSTPTIFENKIYVVNSYGIVSCLDIADGKVVWTVDMEKEFGAKPPKWGIVESPIIVDDKVIFATGGKKDNIVALDRQTGKMIWTSPGAGDLTAYCSPLLFTHNGKRIMCTLTANTVLGIEPETGKVMWTYPKKNTWSVHANTPVYFDGQIYVVSGYGSGGIMLKLSEDGNSITELWTNTTLDNQMGGVVLLNGNIYGSGQNNKSWQCLDWKTGVMKYQTDAIGKGVTIANDGLLYCYSDKGDFSLVKPGENSFEIISKIKITLGSEYHWAHPVIKDGILYMRHGNVLIAYSLKPE